MNTQFKSEFEQLISQPDTSINLAEAALMIARLEYPELNIATYLKQIDKLAEEIRNRLPAQPTASEILHRLNQVLFIEKGFAGNSDHYYDPRNSFLNDVLERKQGIPISLSILYIELGKQLGLPLSGVSFPGHFLVKLDIHDGAIVLDPYFGGISLSEQDLEQRLLDYYGESLRKQHLIGMLESSSNRDIILRVLRNLRNLYMQEDDWYKALEMADCILEIEPNTTEAIKARACIYDKLECHTPALHDYQHYLLLKPNARDSHSIRNRIMDLSALCRQIN